MKTVFLFLSFLSIQLSQAQTTKLIVNVMNFNQTVLSGEQILFESQNSGRIYKGVSDLKGSFDINLRGGDTYNIMIKRVGTAKNYNTLEIPSLKKGEQYAPMTLTIQIAESKSFTLNKVYFETGKSSLQPISFSELNELVEFMTLKSNINIQIDGHTDSDGSEMSNLKLSENRAQAVRQYLIKKGISQTRLKARGYGESRPIADNSSAKGKQQNRRTEIHIIK